jgi:hypothetical protein
MRPVHKAPVLTYYVDALSTASMLSAQAPGARACSMQHLAAPMPWRMQLWHKLHSMHNDCALALVTPQLPTMFALYRVNTHELQHSQLPD